MEPRASASSPSYGSGEVLPEDSKRGVRIYAYANNHYAGFGPATVEQFRELCREKGIEIPALQLPMKLVAGTLFDIPNS
jgi:hypothetical protein